MGFYKFVSCLISCFSMLVVCSPGPHPHLATESERNQKESVAEAEISREQMPEYRLGFGDVIEIRFFNNPGFNERVTVRPDGRITLEKVGDIIVTGMTPSDLEKVVTEKYLDIIKAPEVTVFVREFGNQRIFVLGEVNAPGGYPIARDMTVTQAIAVAGGSKRSAKLSSVLLIRRHTTGEMTAQRINVHEVLSGRNLQNDVALMALDLIYVPKTFIANVDAFVDQFFNILLPPLDAYWRVWWLERLQRK